MLKIEDSWSDEEALTEEFSVRQPKKSDLPAIHKMYIESWKHTYGDYGLSWSNKRIVEDLHRDKSTLPMWLVVEHDGEIVGFLLHSVCLRHLEKIFVRPDYLKTGAGFSLIREYFWKVGRAYGETVTLSLATYRKNERSISFFQQMGYEDSGIGWTVPSSRQELVFMSKVFMPLR